MPLQIQIYTCIHANMQTYIHIYKYTFKRPILFTLLLQCMPNTFLLVAFVVIFYRNMKLFQFENLLCVNRPTDLCSICCCKCRIVSIICHGLSTKAQLCPKNKNIKENLRRSSLTAGQLGCSVIYTRQLCYFVAT